VRQPPHRSVKDIGPVHGVEAVSGDGNDVDVAWRLGRYAVERARTGANPVLVEMFTYRWMEHCGPLEDGHLGYRSEDEIEAWRETCPVAGYRARLEAEGVLVSDAADTMREEIAAEIRQAFDIARQSPFPQRDELATHVFPSGGEGRGADASNG